MLGPDILYLPVSELAKRIQAKQISPVELTRSYLDRSEKIGQQLNAYASLTPELALRQACAAEQEIAAGRYRGPLHGIPYAAKDLLAVKGYPTTWGAKPYANQQFDFDAAVIERLNAAGAVLIGKAAMIELAGGMGYRYASASLTGPAKNPWKETCWTCGSSSGSGAITAAALAAFTLGTETWGSIICPSAFCGISGHRPTYGRVSRYGAMALSYSMDKIGPLARSAKDCEIVLRVIAGHDPRDAGSLAARRAAFTRAWAPRQPKIGWLTNAWKHVDTEVEAASKVAVATLEKNGATFLEAKLPEGPYEAAAQVVIATEGASAFNSLITSGRVADLADPLGQLAGYVNDEIQAGDLLRATRIRRLLQKDMDALLARYDAIVAPSLPVTASTLDANLETELAFPDPLGGIGNLCGLPAVSVPCGFTKAGLPIGIQFVRRPGGDGTVLALAARYQDLSDWHTQRPPIG